MLAVYKIWPFNFHPLANHHNWQTWSIANAWEPVVLSPITVVFIVKEMNCCMYILSILTTCAKNFLNHINIPNWLANVRPTWYSIPLSLCFCRRNDYISSVRDTAEIALKQIGGDEVNRAMQMTKVLTCEIEELIKVRIIRHKVNVYAVDIH